MCIFYPECCGENCTKETCPHWEEIIGKKIDNLQFDFNCNVEWAKGEVIINPILLKDYHPEEKGSD